MCQISRFANDCFRHNKLQYEFARLANLQLAHSMLGCKPYLIYVLCFSVYSNSWVQAIVLFTYWLIREATCIYVGLQRCAVVLIFLIIWRNYHTVSMQAEPAPAPIRILFGVDWHYFKRVCFSWRHSRGTRWFLNRHEDPVCGYQCHK